MLLVEFVAESEIRSLELWLRGARGEDIAEPDDLDKGIALLQKKLANAPEALEERRSPERVQELLDGPIAMFFDQVDEVLGKFDRFFLQPRERWLWFSGDQWEQDKGFPDSEWLADWLGQQPEGDHQIAVGHRFAIYRSEKDPYSVMVSLVIQFDEFRYKLRFALNDPRLVDRRAEEVFWSRTISLVNARYHEPLTEERAVEASKRVGRGVLAYLDARQDDPDHGGLTSEALENLWHQLEDDSIRSAFIGTTVLTDPRTLSLACHRKSILSRRPTRGLLEYIGQAFEDVLFLSARLDSSEDDIPF